MTRNHFYIHNRDKRCDCSYCTKQRKKNQVTARRNDDMRYDLYYHEGPGTSEYVVLFNATAAECDAYRTQYDNARAFWYRLESATEVK